MDQNKIRKPKKAKYVVLIILVLLFAVFAEWLTMFEIEKYEDSFLELYGEEQDGYVKVTIDQIKRLGPNASEADITDIISSIDSSGSEYWTLSTGENILFIKSVTETSRYKNLTSDSYYNTETANNFIKSLRTNQVIHGIIYLGEDRYVASGGLFEWNGNTYSICLVTYDYAILDQNALLEAKNTVIVVITILVAIFICALMIAIMRDYKSKSEIMKQDREEIRLNNILDNLNQKLVNYEAYTARFHTFYEHALPEFLRSLYEKRVTPLRVALFKVLDETKAASFLERMLLTMDNSVLRFRLGNGDILVIFAGQKEELGQKMVELLECEGVSIAKTQMWNLDDKSYVDKYKEFAGEEGGNEQC